MSVTRSRETVCILLSIHKFTEITRGGKIVAVTAPKKINIVMIYRFICAKIDLHLSGYTTNI